MKFKIVPTGTKPSILGLCDGQLLIPGDRGGVEVTEKTRFAPATEAFIAKGWVYVLPVVEAAPVAEVPARITAALEETRVKVNEDLVRDAVAALVSGAAKVAEFEACIANSAVPEEVENARETLRRFAALPPPAPPAGESAPQTRRGRKAKAAGELVAPDAPAGEPAPDATPAEPNAPSLADAIVSGP